MVAMNTLCQGDGAITDLPDAQRSCPICGETGRVTRWRPAFVVGITPFRARYKVTCANGHERREMGPPVDLLNCPIQPTEPDWQDGQDRATNVDMSLPL